ncbi:MAG: DUF86 domain-containing protein [Gemmatimonadota bacterium]
MTPLDRDLVRRKLAVISRNLDDLAVIAELTLEDYRADRFRQKGTERMMQELIEAAVDANAHLLRAGGAPTPTDYYQSFVELGRHGIVPAELAERLAPAAGLRNRLVHEYDRIDDAIVLTAVAEARRDFPAYIAAVQDWLKRT